MSGAAPAAATPGSAPRRWARRCRAPGRRRAGSGARWRRSTTRRWPALHRHRLRLLLPRRAGRHGDAGAAGAARKHAADARPVQPDLHHARHDDDVPLRRAGHGGLRGLPRAADGRHAQHRLPAAECLFSYWVYLFGGRDDLGRLPAEHRRRCRLVRLCAALGPGILARQARRLLGADDHLHRGRGAVRSRSRSSSPSSSSARRE